MSVKLVDLQLIYGIAGAREKFEDLASQLVKSDQLDAGKVRIERGDDGIDVHVGELSDPDGIEVYQCKFFPQGLDDAQKAQIRKSFQTCKEGAKFKTRKWTLCLPVDLSTDEKRWFEDWRKKQADSGIVVDDVWGALKLESLLFQEKNKGLKEAFFKEEYLTQIRELHSTLMSLLPSILKRLNQEASDLESKRRADLRARQDEYISRLMDATRKDFVAIVRQQRSADGPPPPGCLECLIRPNPMPVKQVITSLQDCRAILQQCQVAHIGAPFPDLSHSHPLTGQDCIGGRLNNLGIECWRFSQQVVFAKILSLRDVPMPPSSQPCISLDEMLFRLTQVFRFTTRLAEKTGLHCAMDVSIRLANIAGRPLFPERTIARYHYYTSETNLYNTWHCSVQDLQLPDALAAKAAFWFCERFNWQAATEEILTKLQAAVLQNM